MNRFPWCLPQQEKTNGHPPSNDEDTEDEPTSSLMYGVSLAHLVNLPVSKKKGFTAACKYVKNKTKGIPHGYRSYARWLRNNPDTRHLVSDQATVFVSYAWGGGFGRTMDALKEHFKNKLEETFVWMDFAIVDQHKAATTNIDFHEWAKTFRESLMKIGQAVLVLTPGQKPIAISRSWCCFEWTTIVQANIPFSYCVPVEDEKKLIGRMHKGMGFAAFNTLFAGINVEKAEAYKESDQKSILDLMREVGIKEVNDIVMKSLKKWLLQVAMKAERRATENTIQMQHALNARASLHDALGELDEALSYYEKALACAKFISKKNINFAIQLNNLATLLHDKRDHAAAEPLYREALAIRKKAQGSNHPDVALTLNNLAALLYSKGDYEAAEPLYREALAIRKKAFGDNHSDVATSLNNLAALLKSKGDYEAAEPMCREALDIRKNVHGEKHPDVAFSLNNLGGLLHSKGDYLAAESSYREALDIRRNVLGDNHPHVATVLSGLAELLKDEGKFVEAKELFKQALEIRRNVLGNTHPDVAKSLWGLATIEKDTGNGKDALKLAKEALDISEKALGSNHLTTQEIRSFFESI